MRWEAPVAGEAHAEQLRARWAPGAATDVLAHALSDTNAPLDLRGLVFSGEHLSRLVELSQARGALNLDACVFHDMHVPPETPLRPVRARRSYFVRCSFHKCNLVGLDLAYSHLEDVVFDRCRLERCVFSGAHWWSGGIAHSEVLDSRFREVTMLRGPVGVTELNGRAPVWFKLGGSRFIGSTFRLARWLGVEIAGADVLEMSDTSVLGLEWSALRDRDKRAESSLARLRRRQHEEHGWPVLERPSCYMHPRGDLCSVDLVPLRLGVFVSLSYDTERLRLYEAAIGPAIDDAGLLRLHMYDQLGTGSVTCRECQFIQEARVLVADVTVERPTVYMEIGLAFGRSVPVILTARRGTSLNASLNHLVRIEYDTDEELRARLAVELAAVPDRFPRRGSSLPLRPPSSHP